ncbi:MAG: (2Fe-2S)-binding protein [Planctomycetota bacterium]|nr:(2Fe-2S)-binding protein [Planctomycetota bacterium]
MFPDLPPTYVEHLVQPQNLGDVEDAHAAGEIGSMVGGLGVRITLRFGQRGDDAVIEAAQGRAFGTPAPLPAVSWITGAVHGMTTHEALAISSDDVQRGLTQGGSYTLTERARLGTEMAVQALRRALGDAEAGAPADPTGAGILVCRCLGVGDRTIRAAIHAGAHTPEDIGLSAKACTGCRSCRTDLLALIDEELAEAPRAPDPDRHPVERITLTRAAQVLQSLGAPLEDAHVDGGTVTIHLGTFAQRPMTTPMGAVAITRHLLREVVWDGAHVEADGHFDV